MMITHRKNGWSGCKALSNGKTDGLAQGSSCLGCKSRGGMQSAVGAPHVGSLSATDAKTSAT